MIDLSSIKVLLDGFSAKTTSVLFHLSHMGAMSIPFASQRLCKWIFKGTR